MNQFFPDDLNDDVFGGPLSPCGRHRPSTPIGFSVWKLFTMNFTQSREHVQP